MVIHTINSPKEMFAFGESLAKKPAIFFIQGELGAGKTTLAKGFAQGLGIDPTIVTSPTYTYVQEYNNKLLHIDMYNVDTFDELVEKGIVSLIHDYDYVIIEWPKFVDQLGIDGLSISIEKTGENQRRIICT